VLAWQELQSTRGEALRREAAIKSLSRAGKEALIAATAS
jgi:predicted GIY-YIG superfamily endonuclease